MSASFIRLDDLTEVADRGPTFLTIGVFDGVHLGHQKLLKSMVSAARIKGARPAVLTFYPHPSKIIRGREGRLYLSTLEERVALLAEQGITLIVAQTFDEEVRRTRAADFVDRLCHYLNMKELWGGGFSLGYNREGDLSLLRQLGLEKGFAVHHFEALVKWGGELVSSSRIRAALSEGNAEEVAGCLGRPYSLSGTVVRGDGRGRQIGIPTANLSVWDELMLPAQGVYAAYARVQGQEYLAATNIGYRPTVNGRDLTVEAHLLDFDADIYGMELGLDFVARIRDEQKFSGLDALLAQIHDDIDQVRLRFALENHIQSEVKKRATTDP
jgi:riboflavin kinase/FMN adenylyltransferase